MFILHGKEFVDIFCEYKETEKSVLRDLLLQEGVQKCHSNPAWNHDRQVSEYLPLFRPH